MQEFHRFQMRRGRREKPVISIASIEAALKGFGYGQRDSSEAATLEALALVDLRLAEFSRPSAENLRTFTAQSLLADFLQEGLNEQRQLFDLPPVALNASRKEAEKALSEVIRHDSFSLKAWCCLYYRYLRADLAFTVDALSALLGFSPRNFPRHADDGLRLLRDKLIAAEWQARKLLLRQALQRAIPESIVPLVGRGQALDSAKWALEQNPPIPIFITGAEGIGKSALAAHLAKALIDNDALDYLIWLKQPKRLEDIYNALEDNLLPYPSRVDWRALLGADTLLLVLDDISQLTITADDWESLLGLLSPVYLLIINRSYQLILKRVLPVPLEELNYQESQSLVSQILPRKDLIDRLPLETLGGNPAIINYAVQLMLAGYRPERALNDLWQFYDRHFAELPESSRIAWLLQAAGVDNYDEALIIRNLQNPSARQYIIEQYQNNKGLQRVFQQYLQQTVVSLSIFSADWLQFDTAFILDRLRAYETKTIAELRLWKNLLSNHLENCDADLLVRYGEALRRLNQPNTESFLSELIARFGQTGNFAKQAEARYELALLYQSQSQFEKALAHYQAIESYKQLDKALKQKIFLQYARIAIEQSKAELALQYLQALELLSTEAKILEAEAYLLIGESEKCRMVAKSILREAENHPHLAASLHTILGRSSQSRDAFDHLNAALSLAQQYNNDFDIARAKTNLAAAYLSQQAPYLDEAENLLQEAKTIQSRIQDKLGLSVSSMNLKYLSRLRLSKS